MANAINPSSVCCYMCHESPLYHYRKTPDMGLWYKQMENVIVGNNAPRITGATGSKEIKYDTLFSADHNGGSPNTLSNIATITTVAMPKLYRVSGYYNEV